MTTIIRLGERIDAITRMEFTAHTLPGSKTGWNGRGEGRVTIHSGLEGARRVVRLDEAGEFFSEQHPRPVAFRNRYRLTWFDDRLRLHHERRGEANAVWLFDLVEHDDGTDSLHSEQPHPCGSDSYSATLTLTPSGFSLSWKIEGPRKNECLSYRYS
ncbi:DUF6314 family protein [Halotalea alkalilenta]|uniref:DUF6314 family protein n=1 Tax=Halotalea alkalilenta TaxID=376489 RepID=UPI0012DDAD46|nr:DUF6314 family protein [Halotalea alkalilenta]